MVSGERLTVSVSLVTEIFSSNPTDCTRQPIFNYTLKYALGLQTSLQAGVQRPEQDWRKRRRKRSLLAGGDVRVPERDMFFPKISILHPPLVTHAQTVAHRSSLSLSHPFLNIFPLT